MLLSAMLGGLVTATREFGERGIEGRHALGCNPMFERHRMQDARFEHYAFLVSEEEFDRIFGRIQARGLPYRADPAHKQPGRINHHDGGSGVYTRPYGNGS